MENQGYQKGQIVSVCRNFDGYVFAGRITDFGHCEMEDGRIDEYVWVARGLWGYDEISPATTEQIAAVEKEENDLLGMLAAGEKLIDTLNRCEAAAEAEEEGFFNV